MESFPPELQLAGFIIAIVAFLIAVPALAQRIWGGPKLEVDFRQEDTADIRVLLCELCNPPIKNKALRFLRVRRTALEDVMANFSIAECGSDRVVLTGEVPRIHTYSGALAQRIALPPSIFPATFVVAVASRQDGGVRPSTGEATPLSKGRYYARVMAIAGQQAVKRQRDFVVTQEYPFAYWD